MKIYIMVEFEGGAALVGEPGQTLDASRQAEFARRIMTAEVNAAIEGALAGGATEILVNDWHATGLNLIYDELHPEARVVMGRPRPRRLLGLDDSYKGLFLLGYHAHVGTEGAVMAHTFCPYRVQGIWLNGRQIGEIGIDAALAGLCGVPTVLVTGCDKACTEAENWLGDVVTVTTKIGYGENLAISIHPAKAREQIREAATRAVREVDRFSPLRIPGPYELVAEFHSTVDAERAVTNYHVERISQRKVRLFAEDLAALSGFILWTGG